MRDKKKLKKYIWIGVGAVLLIYLLTVGIGLSRINAERIEQKTAADDTVMYDEIDIEGKNDVLVAENGTKEMYVNPESMNVIVVDKASGIRFEALDPKGTENEASLLRVKYVGKDNVFNTWDSFTYVSETEGYSIHRIDDGVRFDMKFSEGESSKYYEYMPHKMSIERFEDFFIAGLDKAEEDGTLEKDKVKKYKNTLRLVYKKSKQDAAYICNYVGAPPISAVRQLIEVTKAIGYTTDMLIEDSTQYGYTVTFSEPPVFNVALELRLNGDEIDARIPAASLSTENEFYSMQSIEVLPNFSLTAAADVTEGYLFVPDGSGALMRMNTYDSMVPDYVRSIYDNDYYTDYYYIPEFDTNLMMPVFGMYVEQGTKGRHGFLGIIESGADISFIEAMLASGDEAGVGRPYNKIFAMTDIRQYKWVPVFGENSTNQATFLVIEPQTCEDIAIRYILYTDDASYYQMARDYREFLVETSDGRLSDDDKNVNDSASVYLEVLGTLSLNKKILGVPYSAEFSMTKYTELCDILDDLKGLNPTVSYLGVFDEGMNNSLMRTGKTVSENGSKAELNALLAKADETGTTLYMGTDFARVYQGGNGFIGRLHGLYTYNKNLLQLYGFRIATGFAYRYSNSYNILSPKYLPDTVRDFVKGTDHDYNYYLENLTDAYFASYGNEYISPSEANALVDRAIESLPTDSKTALDDPRADKLKYGDIAVDIERKSCEYNSFYCTIPFRQLVLNGLMEYTTGDINNNSTTPRVFLMQAVELGSTPKFVISHQGVDVLKDSYYTGYYSIGYDIIKKDIEYVTEGLRDAYTKIGTARITDHTMIDRDVFVTEYANGTKVVTNYTSLPIEYEGNTIREYDYLIIEGR